MRFGIVLPVWLYNSTRVMWAMNAFDSLVKTQQPSRRPALLIIERDGSLLKAYPSEGHPDFSESCFDMTIIPQSANVSGTEQTLAWGTDAFFGGSEEFSSKDNGVTHCVWMGDDAMFNPKWLKELEALIERHPQAKAWSVYRSAHVRYHAPLSEHANGLDVQVRSICGHGMTFSREEWKEWGIDWRSGTAWPNPFDGGNTLDLRHAYDRTGERYVTKHSFVQHTGSAGLHVTPGIPEYAINFVGA